MGNSEYFHTSIYSFKSSYYDRTLEDFKLTMDTGIPELGMPPLDPIDIDIIEFKFFNLTIAFNNVLMNGFKNFTVQKSVMDKKKRSSLI